MSQPTCECYDPGCPHAIQGHSLTGTVTLYRVDMTDLTGTPMCQRCADDALESGLFTTKAPTRHQSPERI